MFQPILTKEGLPVVSLETTNCLGQDILETESKITALEIATENFYVAKVIEVFSLQFPDKKTRCQGAFYMMAIYQLLKKQAESNLMNQTIAPQV